MTEDVVIHEQAEDCGWGACLPDLPGVAAAGTSRAEVAERIREALRASSDDLRERGEAMPPPHHTAETVTA